jgi:DNA replication and repair protein RecF
MQLSQVEIQRVRNLKQVTLLPAEGLNLIYGSNASGKTSLLEAIYLLSHGRSFRTSNIRAVIQHQTENLQVFGKVKQEKSASFINLGIERGPIHTQIRINQNTVNQTSRLAAYLPVQVINPEAHRLLEQGPSQRRKFLDWGLFHVEPSFNETWQQYNRILKQRNAALRNQQSAKHVVLWDRTLIKAAEKLTNMRQQYVSELIPYIQNYTNRLIQTAPAVQYRQGWSHDVSLTEALQRSLDQDSQQGFTRNGPHRADLRITIEGVPVQEHFSRGQQKLLVCAMRLAQISHLKNRLDQYSVVLVDDLAAELDIIHRKRLLELLVETGAQLFITVTEAELIDTEAWLSRKMFHVEHGQVVEVV